LWLPGADGNIKKMSGNLQITDARLEPIAQRVLSGERLTAEDGLALFQSSDLLTLGWLGNHVREKRHGNICYYNVNRHINPTNVCMAHCRLCAFGRSPDSPGAYTYALDEVWSRAAEGVGEGATEFHIVGGLHPDLPFEYYLELIRGLKQRFPQVHLKAFTMVEVGFYSRISKLSIRDTLQAMKDAGVDSLPGGGAEIFHPRVRKIICDHKTSGLMWLQIAQAAHEIGLRSNATMLYGHIETPEERVDHLMQLRALQDKTHGFVTFIPLAFHPANTALAHLPSTTGFDDLKTIAISRLLLDNFDHIKAYWIMLTPRIAQIALRFGANDLDGTVVEEKIYHDAGATTPEHLTRRTRAADSCGRPGSRGTRHALQAGGSHEDAVSCYGGCCVGKADRWIHPRIITYVERVARSLSSLVHRITL
jgi:aminodeoxyfutalosine synthase